jgi:hypothetical protein
LFTHLITGSVLTMRREGNGTVNNSLLSLIVCSVLDIQPSTATVYQHPIAFIGQFALTVKRITGRMRLVSRNTGIIQFAAVSGVG